MNGSEDIQQFFDRMSIGRNHKILSEPRLQYEQDMRQQAVLELLSPRAGEHVLDAGAGNLRDSLVFSQAGLLTYALDLSLDMLLEGLQFVQGVLIPKCIQGSAMALPFPDAFFDKISCSEVIEHIPAYPVVLAEFHRCLKQGGVLVITTPNWQSLYGVNRRLIELLQKLVGKKPWGGHPYDSWKTPVELEKTLQQNGFIVEKEIGICFLPGFTFGLLLPNFLQKWVVKIVSAIEKRIRLKAARYGYGIGIRARKRHANLMD